MTHAEFHNSIKAIAQETYFSTSVNIATGSSGDVVITYQAFLSGIGCTGCCRAPEEAIEQLNGLKRAFNAQDPRKLG